jgi:hypothetical protein
MDVDTPMGGAGGGDVAVQTEQTGNNNNNNYNNSHDDSMNTTITQSTIQAAMPDYQNGQFSASHNSQHDSRPHTSYSDTGFASRPYSHSMSHSDVDNSNTPPQYRYSQQGGRPNSRPPSAMSGTSQGGGGGGGSGYDRYQHEVAYAVSEQTKQPKVIIKVGMVGDAQIGKTSLMVKYVEGSWDEDYIQTLGVYPFCMTCVLHAKRLTVHDRRQLYGEDNLHPQHRSHLQHMGSRWATRIRQHASARLQ